MARAATSRLKVNAPLGSPPTLEWRAVNELLIDDQYQRTVDTGPSQTLIRRIAMFWDWGLCQPLSVSRRPDGKLLIVDGQHRASAAKMRGDIPHLPCVITSYSSSGDEAAAFVALNQMRRPLSVLDVFKAAVVAEDKEALEIQNAVSAAGLRIAPHMTSAGWKTGMIGNIGGLRECLRGKGEQTLRTSLTVISRAYANEVLRYVGTIFPGIAHVVADAYRLRSSGDEILEEFVPVVAAKTQTQWAKEIIILSPECPRGRRGAAWQVFEEAWHARLLAPPTLPVVQGLVLDPGEVGWCDQCDRKVSGQHVARCADRFCSLKAKAAA
jgi:hypothetical protein